ncbi:MAG: DUF1294 domain-containing protein [Thaumarchaeota archaeon]|nr:DUF1294 domain-containing protein [Nitrososphaerota archaeon]
MRESTLFAISLAGGFWGILLGGFLFRHKTSKISFLVIVYGTAIAWALLTYRLVVLEGCLP